MPTFSARMSRDEAIAYCDERLPRLKECTKWNSEKGWGAHFHFALWFSDYEDSFFITREGVAKTTQFRGFEHLPEAVEKFKRQMIAERLTGCASSR